MGAGAPLLAQMAASGAELTARPASSSGAQAAAASALQSSRAPARWSHPLVLPPSVLAVALVATAVSAVLLDHPACWAALAAAAALSLAWCCFLLVLWLLGCACCREEGPRREGPRRTSDAFSVDTLQVGSGALGMSAAPGRKRKRDQRDLLQDVRRIAELRFDAVVTLMEPRELRVMECEQLGAALGAQGVEWLHFPIRDKWIPGSTQAWEISRAENLSSVFCICLRIS